MEAIGLRDVSFILVESKDILRLLNGSELGIAERPTFKLLLEAFSRRRNQWSRLRESVHIQTVGRTSDRREKSASLETDRGTVSEGSLLEDCSILTNLGLNSCLCLRSILKCTHSLDYDAVGEVLGAGDRHAVDSSKESTVSPQVPEGTLLEEC